MNSFMVFAKKRRKELQEKYPDKDNKTISQILGKEWKNMSDFDKEKFIEEAKVLAEKHKQEHPDWKFKRDTSKKKRKSTQQSESPVHKKVAHALPNVAQHNAALHQQHHGHSRSQQAHHGHAQSQQPPQHHHHSQQTQPMPFQLQHPAQPLFDAKAQYNPNLAPGVFASPMFMWPQLRPEPMRPPPPPYIHPPSVTASAAPAYPPAPAAYAAPYARGPVYQPGYDATASVPNTTGRSFQPHPQPPLPSQQPQSDQ